MSGKSGRKRSTARAASKARSDQRSDPKPIQYKLRRKIPDPAWSLSEIVRPHVSKSPRRAKASDEQLAIAPVESVSPEEAQPFLKWVGGKAQLLTQLDEFFPTQNGLGWELKTTSLRLRNDHWKPKETLAITMINPKTDIDIPFLQSHLWAKLKKTIVCG